MQQSLLTLENLLKNSTPQISSLVDKVKVRIVRHAMENRKDGDWAGFDNMLQFDKELLKVFTAEQNKDKFKNAELILVFVASESSKCLLRGSFWSKGKIESKEFFSKNLKYQELERFRKSRGIVRVISDQAVYYDLEECTELSELSNRLVIEWGKSTVSWVQSKLNKEIWELLPKGFVSTFPGWDKVFISHQKLKAIIQNPDGNKDWFQFLYQHDGIYVILDTKSGKKYVGSAYAENEQRSGIWGRWSGYARTSHNGNKALVELLGLDPSHSENFMYSIHHVYPKGTKTKREIITVESLLKEKLGTKGIFGLNRN